MVRNTLLCRSSRDRRHIEFSWYSIVPECNTIYRWWLLAGSKCPWFLAMCSWWISHVVIDYLLGSIIVTYPCLVIALSKLFSRFFSASASKMAASDSMESVDWPAAILDSRCRWTPGQSLTHSQADDRRSLNLDIEGFVSHKYNDSVAETWRNLFHFITATMMIGLAHET